MVFNYEFDTGEMHSDAFTERARFAHQHPTALAQRTVDGLHDARAAAAFGAAAVLPAGQSTDAAFPQVGEISAAHQSQEAPGETAATAVSALCAGPTAKPSDAP